MSDHTLSAESSTQGVVALGVVALNGALGLEVDSDGPAAALNSKHSFGLQVIVGGSEPAIDVHSKGSAGVYVQSESREGIHADSMTGSAVYAASGGLVEPAYTAGSPGVYATSTNGPGVYAKSLSENSYPGVYAQTLFGSAVYAESEAEREGVTPVRSIGVEAHGATIGVAAYGMSGPGLHAESTNDNAIEASSVNHSGLVATSTNGSAIEAFSTKGFGVRVSSQQATGLAVAVGSATDLPLGQALVEQAGHGIASLTEIQDAAGIYAYSSKGPGAKVFGRETGMLVSIGPEPQDKEHFGHAIVASTNVAGAAGLYAQNDIETGVDASSGGFGVFGQSTGTGTGVFGQSTGTGTGVSGQSTDTGTGVVGYSYNGIAVVAVSEAGIALRVEGPLNVQGPAVGQVTTNGGEISLQVNSTAATAQSSILLTPLSNPGAYLWIASRAAGTFTIGASQPMPSNLIIQFLIIN